MPRVHINRARRIYEHIEYSQKGVPEFEPEEWHRKMAQELAGYGVPQHHIAKILGISILTLRRHLIHELELGLAQTTAMYLKTAYMKIMNGDTFLLALYLRTRAGWVEPKEARLDGDNTDVETLSDDELHAELESLTIGQTIAARARGLEAPMP